MIGAGPLRLATGPGDHGLREGAPFRAIAASRPRTAQKRRHELVDRSGEEAAPQPPADEVRRWDSSRVKET